MRALWGLVAMEALVSQTKTPPVDALTLDQDHPAILWLTADVADPISRLNLTLKSGGATLAAQGQQSYLSATLKALEIPVSSQMLVYSRTSLQRNYIHPGNPRALYFNDTTVVGYIPGSPFLEAAVMDPRQGVVFYTLNQSAAEPRFVRQTSCTMCHETQMGVPGFVLQSMPTATDGQALYQLGYWPATDQTPFENRWGGWYVTGRHAPFAHMGNRTVANPRQPGELAVSAAGLEKAPNPFNANDNYPAQTSDIAALLVFEHQVETANWITRLGWHARIVEYAKQPTVQLQPTVDALVDAMLFAGEVELPAPVSGTSGFAKEFVDLGPHDRQGRSLRDLDLRRHVFRYPLSYLIYSPAFDALPPVAKSTFYQTLWRALTAREPDARYPRLDSAMRQTIRQILADTKQDIPSYFVQLKTK